MSAIGRPAAEAWAFTAFLVVLCMMGGAALRGIGAPLFAVVILAAMLYARGAMLSREHLPAIVLTGLGLVYVGLSYASLFPAAWTRHHENGIIIQQASFVFALLPLTAAFQKWWEDAALERRRGMIFVVIVFAVFVLSIPVSLFVHGDMESLADTPKPFLTLQYDVLIGLIAVSYLAMRRLDPVAGLAVLGLVLILSIVIEFRLQNVQAYAAAFAIALVAAAGVKLDRWILNVLIGLFLALAVYGIIDPVTLFILDHNTGWRVLFWRDALEAVARTWGLGVGFGTEALRNEYMQVVGRANFLPDENTSFMLIGTHNGFVDVFLRLGVVGLVLWCAIVARCYPAATLPLRIRAHACVVFAAVFICIYSNVALQSPLYLIGIAFALGYLRSVRRTAPLAIARPVSRVRGMSRAGISRSRAYGATA